MFNFTLLIASRAAWLQPRQEYNIQLGFLQHCGVETTGRVEHCRQMQPQKLIQGETGVSFKQLKHGSRVDWNIPQ